MKFSQQFKLILEAMESIALKIRGLEDEVKLLRKEIIEWKKS